MCLVSNQPACLFATAKTNKFNTIDELKIEHVKLCPRIGSFF